ncbi:hypothetical protein D6D13_03997 [Aureobasidium pullulans]|uniref:HIT-type domain-containing protein n=1 Tax=Aureobasidium pullulans TaxID=5580 RepID=A0A4S9CZ21_AURPU|nr:hypothetical protein D6D13_03997 [Aureobasidium pullulans]
MADSSTPLTALCNICHSVPPKYTCPRDKVRTCSLACSQAHKRRAACTGVRDPSAYVSKSALATAGGIDRDYNFLSGLERNIDRADKETTERGVSLSGHGKPVFQKRWHDNGALGKYLRENGIMVHKAPIGMARQKANQTRFIQKSKRIVWSVEWVVDGEKRIAEVDESRTMQEAYKELVLEKERENKKRKRVQDDASAKSQKQKVRSEKVEALETQPQSEGGAVDQEKAVSEVEGVATTIDPTIAPSADESKTDDSSEQQQQPPLSQDEPSTTAVAHFYLHKPHTSSTNTVLIPIASDTILTHALRHKDVLEFPTIYVFNTNESSHSQNPATEAAPAGTIVKEGETSQLPKGFITLDQYNQEISAEDKELMGLMESIPEGQRKVALDGGIFGGVEEKREEVDEKQILEVLQRDADALKE